MTEKVTELLKKKNLDAILISDGYNMRYLSGFGGATGYLYISADQKVLMTDSRYTTQAKQEAPKFAVVEVSTEKGYRELITECIRKDQADKRRSNVDGAWRRSQSSSLHQDRRRA
mgnify:CR=1 FL=1